jgi:hypothetical protein
VKGDDSNGDRVVAVSLLKPFKRGWIETPKRSLQFQHVIADSSPSRSLFAGGHLERLLLLVRNERKKKLEPGVL